MYGQNEESQIDSSPKTVPLLLEFLVDRYEYAPSQSERDP